MPNDYTGIKRVRQLNGQKFIDDFHSAHTVCASPELTGCFLQVSKQDVWRCARDCKINYTMTIAIYKNNRMVMLIS